MQGKESICIDIAAPEGVAIVQRLAARSDVVLQGFRAGAAERPGSTPRRCGRSTPTWSTCPHPGTGRGRPTDTAPHSRRASGRPVASAGPTSVTPSRATGPYMEEIREGAIRLSGSATVTSAQADGFAALGVASALLLGLVARARVRAARSSTVDVADGQPRDGRSCRGLAGNPARRQPGRRSAWAACQVPDLRRDRRVGVPRRPAGTRVGAAGGDALAPCRSAPRPALRDGGRPCGERRALTDTFAAVFATGSKASWEHICWRRTSGAWRSRWTARGTADERLVRAGERVRRRRRPPHVRPPPSAGSGRPVVPVGHPGQARRARRVARPTRCSASSASPSSRSPIARPPGGRLT